VKIAVWEFEKRARMIDWREILVLALHARFMTQKAIASHFLFFLLCRNQLRNELLMVWSFILWLILAWIIASAVAVRCCCCCIVTLRFWRDSYPYYGARYVSPTWKLCLLFPRYSRIRFSNTLYSVFLLCSPISSSRPSALHVATIPSPPVPISIALFFEFSSCLVNLLI
jgi:hypothetical protein